MMSARTASSRQFHTVIGMLCLLSGAAAVSQSLANPSSLVNQPPALALALRGSARVSTYGKLPLAFEVNQGQTDARVKFLSRGRGYALFLTGDEAVLTLGPAGKSANRAGQSTNVKTLAEEPAHRKLATEDSQLESVLRMKLVGGDVGAAVAGADKLPGTSNYFIGNDPRKWRTDVVNYARVRYQDVYPGVDLVYYGNQGGQLEYDFVVAPGADPNVVTLDVGANVVGTRKGQRRSSLRIAADGDLVVKINGGEVRFQKPIAYQEQFATRHSLDGRYVLRGGRRIGFEVASYDHSKPLIIDPVLSYSTFLGGSGNDTAKGIALDSAGNAYVTGYTNSTNFPTTPGTLQTVLGPPSGAQNAYVTKLNAAGSALVYSTYLGGNNADQGFGIAVDSAGSAYVTGYTQSPNFPMAHPVQATLVGGQNAFVTKLNAAGNALVYSTYLGGNNSDAGRAIAVDSAGSAYVSGSCGTNFPTTTGAFQRTPGTGGSSDAFVTKFNAAGSALVYSTLLGGNNVDFGYGIAVDSAGNAYVTGLTTSTDFPTANPFQSINAGGSFGNGNAFVTKLNASGTALVYSTYLGGSNISGQGHGGDTALAIAVDSAGSAYVTGSTASSNFPTTANAFDVVCNACIPGPSANAFVTKFNAAGNALVYSTFLGGTATAFSGSTDVGYGIAVDSAGNAYVTGLIGNPGFPTLNPIVPNGGSVFVTELNAAGSALVYSTPLGAAAAVSGDVGYGIAVDSAGNAYVAGVTGNTDFPTTRGAFQTTLGGGGGDAFVAKIAPGNAAPAVSLSAASLTFSAQNVGTTSASQTETVTNTGTANLTLSTATLGGANAGDFAKGSDTCTGATVTPAGTCKVVLTFTPSAAGSRSASLSFADNAVGSPQAVTLSGTGVATVPQALLTPSPVAFGNQASGTSSAVQVVVLSNPGTASLNITSLTLTGASSSAFSVQSACGAVLLAGASCNISTMFSPTTIGALSAAITVVDNAANSPQSDTLTGTGTAALAPQAVLAPATVPFANQISGTTSASQTVTLSNPGTATLNITSITLGGSNPAAFALTNGCGATLAVGSSCPLTITFTPGGVTSFSASINVVDNASNSPQGATLSGTGTAPLVPQASLNPATISFANQVSGTTSTSQTVTLSNPGNAALTITGITLTGANSTAFALTNGCGTSLAAGANCLLSVTFTPGAVGTFAAAITVADNAAGSPQSASLSGTGAAPPDFTTSSPTPPQTVTAGAAATYQISVTSAAGIFNLPVTLSATGLPTGATAVFTPPIVTPGSTGSTSSLVIQTSATMAELRDGGQEHRRPARSNTGLFEFASSGIGMACLLFFRRVPRFNHGGRLLLVVAGLFLMSLGISACGGGFPESATARSFTITVTGTNGADIHATTITLTVK
jgi:hypothetical protein